MSRALCPGSVGELVQGLRRGKEVLVSLTVDRLSEITVLFGEETPEVGSFWKTRKAISLALREWGREDLQGKITFRRRSTLPVGKGFASSTADIAAALGSLAHLLGKQISEEFIARVALRIEPTDGTFFSPFCLFDHLRGEVLIRLPLPKSLGVVVVELPGEVETLGVDREKLYRNWEDSRQDIEEAFVLLERGLEERDLHLVARAATISSLIMQEVEREEVLTVLLENLKTLGALGVNRAHTGKALGVLFDLRVYGPRMMEERVRRCLQGYPVDIWSTRAIAGGVRVIRP
jgi:L-threonine kinase